MGGLEEVEGEGDDAMDWQWGSEKGQMEFGSERRFCSSWGTSLRRVEEERFGMFRVVDW